MRVLGNANWWIPAWLDRVLPRLDVEGAARQHTQESPEVGP
jgi:RND superfamily putative drug exporter